MDESAEDDGAQGKAASGQPRSSRYPDYKQPFVGSLQETDERFAELREELLLGYGYNTARAYWGDLDDIHDWAVERGLDVLELSEADVRRYVTLLRRRQYSENTVRRRVTALRALCDVLFRRGQASWNPASAVVIRRPHTRECPLD